MLAGRRAYAALTVAAILAPAIRSAPATLDGIESDFSEATVPDIARALARRAHRRRAPALPRSLDALDYDGYRRIRYRADRAIWKDQGLGFQLQPHHRGFLFKERVDLFDVAEGKARAIVYNPDDVDLGGLDAARLGPELGFAGFRLLHPLNRADHFDEVCSFLGASYFRAVGRNHVYGLSARALAIRTAHPAGEEFPAFTALWIDRPGRTDDAVTIHALLESQSLTGAFRIVVRPGQDTVMEVTARLFARVDVDRLGIAPGTSMFFFGPGDPAPGADYRPAVHDSDGLLMATGAGERLWRPLANPSTLQVSGFQDSTPRGFGLMQRRRAFPHFEDLEAQYHRRPGLWVEPLAGWGQGEVNLVEIPTTGEIHDNIVAAWIPARGLRAGEEAEWRYRLRWTSAVASPADQVTFDGLRVGRIDDGALRYVLDTSAWPAAAALPEASIATTAGAAGPGIVQRNPETGGLRVTFAFRPGTARLAEFRLVLRSAQAVVSETWTHRWTV
jgi:glucans biosynthesis protein